MREKRRSWKINQKKKDLKIDVRRWKRIKFELERHERGDRLEKVWKIGTEKIRDRKRKIERLIKVFR